MARGEPNVIQDLIKSIRYAIRHRHGREVPAAILDTLDVLYPEEKPRPELIRGGIQRTSDGWLLIFTLQPGVSFSGLERHREFFSDATGVNVSLSKTGKTVRMFVQEVELGNDYPFEFNPGDYPKMILPFPAGYAVNSLGAIELEVVDLVESGPHLIIAGETGGGKSNAIRVVIHSLLGLEWVFVILIDFKGLDYGYLKDRVLLVEDEELASKVLSRLVNEYERRRKILRAAGVSKIQYYRGPESLPYLVCIIDEFAEIQDKGMAKDIDRLARLARAVGIHLVACTQKPSSKVINTDTRSQFPLRMCYAVSSESDSRMVLGEKNSEAAWLADIRGRGLLKRGRRLIEVQTPNLPDDLAKQLARQATGTDPKAWWGHQPRRLPPR